MFSNVLEKAYQLKSDLFQEESVVDIILKEVKDREAQGYRYEKAEASFELLVKNILGLRRQPFEIVEFQIHCKNRKLAEKEETISISQAIVRIRVNQESNTVLSVAEGNGAISALDLAIRKVLQEFYPNIENISLTDYQVEILDSHEGTSAKTLVLISFRSKSTCWTTIGISGSIIDASYQALIEGLEYGLLLQLDSNDSLK